MHIDVNKPKTNLRKQHFFFCNWSKTIKYLWVNVRKEVQNLYSENYKTWLEEIEEDLDKCKHIYVHESENLILLR